MQQGIAQANPQLRQSQLGRIAATLGHFQTFQTVRRVGQLGCAQALGRGAQYACRLADFGQITALMAELDAAQQGWGIGSKKTDLS